MLTVSEKVSLGTEILRKVVLGSIACLRSRIPFEPSGECRGSNLHDIPTETCHLISHS